MHAGDWCDGGQARQGLSAGHWQSPVAYSDESRKNKRAKWRCRDGLLVVIPRIDPGDKRSPVMAFRPEALHQQRCGSQAHQESGPSGSEQLLCNIGHGVAYAWMRAGDCLQRRGARCFLYPAPCPVGKNASDEQYSLTFQLPALRFMLQSIQL